MNSGIILEDKGRKVSHTGGSDVMYMPTKIRDYIKHGDMYDMVVKIEGKNLVITAKKILFGFDLDDVRDFAVKNKFSIKEDRVIGGVEVFEAEKKNLAISCTRNNLETFSPAYATVSLNESNLDYDGYYKILDKAKHLKEFDVVVMPEGDLDTVNLLNDPKRYKMTEKAAIEGLCKLGKNVGMSLTIRFNSKENSLDQIKSALSKIS